MNKYKAILFDLDSTLTYTLPDYRYLVVGGILQELGITSAPEGFVDKLWFEGNRAKTIKDALGIEPGAFFRKYNQHDKAEIREQYTRLFPDVDYLNELKQAGYKLGVVTGGSPHVMGVNIKLLGEGHFDVLVSANPTAKPPLPSKPDPEGIYLCLERLQVAPEQAMFIGNGDEDVNAAKNAGVLDVLILRGEHEPPPTPASVTITSLYGLRALL